MLTAAISPYFGQTKSEYQDLLQIFVGTSGDFRAEGPRLTKRSRSPMQLRPGMAECLDNVTAGTAGNGLEPKVEAPGYLTCLPRPLIVEASGN
jgi:hypothetical protein